MTRVAPALVRMMVILVIALPLPACNAKVGPFVPPGSPVCSSDADCPVGEHCAFPAPGWKARCMQGDDGLTTPPEEMRRRDGGQ